MTDRSKLLSLSLSFLLIWPCQIRPISKTCAMITAGVIGIIGIVVTAYKKDIRLFHALYKANQNPEMKELFPKASRFNVGTTAAQYKFLRQSTAPYATMETILKIKKALPKIPAISLPKVQQKQEFSSAYNSALQSNDTQSKIDDPRDKLFSAAYLSALESRETQVYKDSLCGKVLQKIENIGDSVTQSIDSITEGANIVVQFHQRAATSFMNELYTLSNSIKNGYKQAKDKLQVTQKTMAENTTKTFEAWKKSPQTFMDNLQKSTQPASSIQNDATNKLTENQT
jgi:hypothetical protein